MTGWESADLVLGLVEVRPGAEDDGGEGFSWTTDRLSYAADQLSTPSVPVAVPVAVFTAVAPTLATEPAHVASATFCLYGSFGSVDGVPAMSDCRVVCADHDGWGECFGLSVAFSGLSTAVGTAQDPRLRFRCAAQLWRIADGQSTCRTSFVLDVDSGGRVDVGSYQVHDGQASVTTGSQFQLYYDASPNDS